MEGKICVITGANSGIGKELSRQLGELGATVVMVGRNSARLAEAQQELQRAAPAGKYELVVADLSRMARVREAAQQIRERFPRVDVLANNAGIYLPDRRVTAEGFEEMFAVNHLAAFLLTHELLEALAVAGGARVITTSSFGHRLGHMDFEDLQAARSFNGLRQYSTTKLANILFTRELARRVKERGIVAHAYHPGAVASGFAQDELGIFGVGVKLAKPFLRSAKKAATTGTYLATSADALTSSGEYWANSKRRTPSKEARSDEVSLRLWDVTERMLGLKV